jgi:hypothetical protein
VGSLGYFGHLAGYTLEWMAYYAPVSLGLGLLACTALGRALYHPRARWGRLLTACLVPAVIPACVLAVGVAFVRPEALSPSAAPLGPWFSGVPPRYPDAAIDSLGLLLLPMCLGLCWLARRAWWAALAASLWWGWVTWCASVVAGMSVTGAWL